MTQLLTAWDKQVLDYEQQSGDTMADAINSRAVLRHLPDASLREHLLLNSESYDRNSLWKSFIFFCSEKIRPPL